MKEVKLGVLDDIKKMMGDRMASKIGKPKAVSVEVEASTPKEEMQPEEHSELGVEKPEMTGELDQSKLTPEELMQLKALYEKMC